MHVGSELVRALHVVPRAQVADLLHAQVVEFRALDHLHGAARSAAHVLELLSNGGACHKYARLDVRKVVQHVYDSVPERDVDLALRLLYVRTVPSRGGRVKNKRSCGNFAVGVALAFVNESEAVVGCGVAKVHKRHGVPVIY